MKKIFIVTGAAGFLGNNVVRLLAKNPDNDIRALLLPSDKGDALAGVRCTVFRGDVTRNESLSHIFDVPDGVQTYVIHCASVVYIKSRFNKSVSEVNVGGTKNIVDRVMSIGAKLVYISSVHAIPEKPDHAEIEEVYDFDPGLVKGLYAKTKAEAAAYVLDCVRHKGLDACIIHPSGLVGPGDYGRSHLTQLIVDFVSGRLTACVRGGYDFVDVRDVAEGVVSACEYGKRGSCYILSNKYIEIKDFLDIVSRESGRRPIRTVLPMWLAKATAPLSELYYALLKQPPLYTSYSLYTITSNSNFSNAKARKELSYTVRDLRDTVRDTLEWLGEHKRIKLILRPV